MHNQIASFRAELDAQPVSRYQWLILLLLALLLAMHIPVQQIFFFCAIPGVIAALLIIQVRSPEARGPKSPLHRDILKNPIKS